MAKFSFTPEITRKALEYLMDYKTIMDGRAVDFNSDKAAQYEYIRMTFVEDDAGLIQSLGPASTT